MALGITESTKVPPLFASRRKPTTRTRNQCNRILDPTAAPIDAAGTRPNRRGGWLRLCPSPARLGVAVAVATAILATDTTAFWHAVPFSVSGGSRGLFHKPGLARTTTTTTTAAAGTRPYPFSGISPFRLFFSRVDEGSADRKSYTSEAMRINPNLRGCFVGSGSDGMSNPLIVEQILELLPPGVQQRRRSDPSSVNVLYIGTATYDLLSFRKRQTKCFVDLGFTVDSLDVALADANPPPDREKCASKLEAADVIVVGGGNTLFAVDRWKQLGLVPYFRKAMERQCVLTGGSAGAICWFDSGHSDSADPDTYVEPMLRKFGESHPRDNHQDESSAYDEGNKKEWKYLRVPGLGFVPGKMICCPHHDRIQSNGLLRADDFDAMLLKRAASLSDRSTSRDVVGIGIDHHAAFIVEGSRYRVYSLPDEAGSVGSATGAETDSKARFSVRADGTAEGVPGVWIKRAGGNSNDEDQQPPRVKAAVCPSEGDLAELLGDIFSEDGLCDCEFDSEFDDDDENRIALELCRRENPSATSSIESC